MDLSFAKEFFYPLMLLVGCLLLAPSAKPVGVLGWARLIVSLLCGIWGVVWAFGLISVSG